MRGEMLIKRILENHLPIFIFAFTLASLFLVGPAITGFSVVNVNTLNTSTSNTPITGTIDIQLTEPIEADSILKLTFNNQVYSKSLKEILDEQLLTYEETGEITKAKNPKSSMILIYPQAGQQQTAIKLPKGAIIDSVEADVKGDAQDGSYPQFPFMDIQGDGNYEWQYFGNLLGYATTSTSGAGLDLTGTEGNTIVQDLATTYYYCELINLPYAKDYTVSAKYALDKAGGDLKAAILGYSTSAGNHDAFGGTDKCDLPESTTAAWSNCTISLQQPALGNHLVCVYNDKVGQQGSYKLSKDQIVQSTAFTCDKPLSGQSICNKITTKDDFYITATPGAYDPDMKTQTKLSDGFTQNYMTVALEGYLKDCITDECVVPIKVNSQSKGKIILSNLKVRYTSSGLTSEETNFYDVEYTPSLITKINNVDLGTYNLTLSLSDFGLTTPTPTTDSGTYNLKVELGSLSSTYPISVEKVFDISKVQKEKQVSATKSRIEKLNTEQSELLGLTGLSSEVSAALSELNDFQSQIDAIVQSSDSASVKEEKIQNILNAMEDKIRNVPVSINPVETISDTFLAEPDDINQGVMLPGQSEVDLYEFQKKVTVRISATAYEIVKGSGVKETKTMIRRSVTSNTPNTYIYEVIPKSIAASVNDLTFSERPEVIQADPIVRWFYPNLATKSITYVVNGNAMAYINNIKTIVTPQVIPISEKATCGNNRCEFVTINDEKVWLETADSCPVDCKQKIPWGWIIFLLILLILGLYYINWYRGKYAFKEITGGLFSSKADYKNLYRYIEATIKQKVPRPKVEEKLKEKGWTKQQLDYVFRKVQRDLSGEKGSLLKGIKAIFKKKVKVPQEALSPKGQLVPKEKKPGLFSKLFKKK